MNLEKCTEYISNWYFADTIELLDLVLDDDVADPQYSAITALNRLWVYLQYKKGMNKCYAYNDVSSLLEKMGYSPEDIALFRKKAQEERKIYTADILGTEFLEDLK